MKNYLISLVILVLLGMFSQSCTEKQNLKENGFEYETVLKDNKSLLNEVNDIVSQYDENAHKLRMGTVESFERSSVQQKYRELTNNQKAMVWKDRIIYDLKNKKFDAWQYDYFVEIFNNIKPNLFDNGSIENNEFKEKVIDKWEFFSANNMDYSELMKTLFLLSDNIVCSKSKDQNEKTVDCDCSWGGFCLCEYKPCRMTLGGCGLLYVWNCIKLCHRNQQ